MSNIKKLSIIYLDDNDQIRKMMEIFLQDFFDKELSAGIEFEIKTTDREEKAIDALSMAEGPKLLLSDLQMNKNYPFKLWNYAAENKTPMMIISGYEVEKDYVGKFYEENIRLLKNKYPNVDIEYVYKLDNEWWKKVLEAIKEKFPKLFKPESDKQPENREGRRLR